MHLTGGTAPTAMGLLWGYPFLTAGLGLDLGTAAFVFTMLVVGNVTTGPVLGYLVTRYPVRRSNLALFVVSIILVVWAVVGCCGRARLRPSWSAPSSWRSGWARPGS
ncbi:MAG: hypothetical protein R2717_09125 [Schumannella sp.]